MSLNRRTVTFTAEFIAKAKRFYPPGGSVDGKPRYEHFRPLMVGVEFAFARGFDDLTELAPNVRVVSTDAVTFFPPITFYGSERLDGSIDVTDFEPDDTWFDQFVDDDDL